MQAWNLKFSDPNRGGKFLNIPIHYGDWVPITAAKALVEEVANRHRGVLDTSDQVQAKVDTEPVESDRRADHAGVVYVDTKHRGYQTQFRHPQPHQQHQQHQQHKRPVHNNNVHNHRRQDASKAIRFSHVNHNNINVDASRRNTKKLPPPPVHFNQVGQNVVRNKPVQPQQQQSTFSFVPSFNSFSAFNPFNFFDTSKPAITTPAPRGVALPVNNDKSSVNVNAIQTIPAPDLSKYGPGPPVIELDSGADGEIILGRPFNVGGDHDHLAGFVSLDFDGFTPGDREDKKSKKAQQEKEKLSIIVGGKSKAKPRDQSDLVNFLNNDKENTETFVFSSDKQAPQGFAKIDLPFMDPSKHRGDLPKAFIAPKGIPIPDGYKGKPLPHQPHGAAGHVTSTEKVLIHQVDTHQREDTLNLFRTRQPPVSRYPDTTEQEKVTNSRPVTTERPSFTSSNLFSSSSLRFKTKNRPSLTEFIRKNKKKAALLEEKNDNDTDNIKDTDDKVYINNKIEKTRKEFLESYKPSDSTVPPLDVIIPVENNFNTFKLVTENHEAPHSIVDDNENNIIDVISAGEDDNDPISLVFEPQEVLTTSTLEQAEQEDEVTQDVETSTSFAPTVVTTTVADTTTPTERVVADTTTVAQSTTTSSTTTTTTTTTVTTTTSPESTERFVRYTTQDPFARLESLRKKKYNYSKDRTSSTSAPSYQDDLLTAEDIDDTGAPSTESPAFNFASPFRQHFRPIRKYGGSGNEKDFGRRIKKRPGFWVKKYSSDAFGGSIEPTRRPYKYRNRLASQTSTTTTETILESVKEEYKQKYRPFFEGIYSQLTEKPETESEETSRRFGLPRRRSTTPNPLPSSYTVGKI